MSEHRVHALSVVIPAYREAAAIAEVVRETGTALAGIEHEILVVDDGSDDDTAAQARAAGARVIDHPMNKGYGASLKTGIRFARYEWIALLDGDGQHDPRDLLKLMDAMDERYDMVIGARDAASFQYASRLPGKRFLQWFAAFLVGERPADVNSGMRLFRKADVLPLFPLLPNGFSFTTTQTLAMLKDAFRVGAVPITTRRREGEPSTVRFRDGLAAALLIIRIAALFNPLKVFMPISGALMILGAGYAGVNIALHELNIPDGAQLLVIAGVVIFCFGILADQLASIRRTR